MDRAEDGKMLFITINSFVLFFPRVMRMWASSWRLVWQRVLQLPGAGCMLSL